MFQTIKEKIARDKDFPERQFEIDVLTRVLDGKLYDHIKYDFHQEKIDGVGEYIPIRDRRPSVRYALCRIVVDDSISLLFSEGHFPAIECKDDTTADALELLVKDSKLNMVMIEAATTGSVGSVAILLRVLKNRAYFLVMNTQYLKPVWNPEAPDKLIKVIEQYKVKGSVLQDMGYSIGQNELSADFWFHREFDETSESWFLPEKVSNAGAPQFTPDPSKSVKHMLGFVPVVWVKNLPGGDDIDGRCTFPSEAIDTQIEIDYQLSQAGRGLKYSSDPTLLIKEPASDSDGKMIKGGGNAIVVGPDGDAKMLEIDGTASEAVIAYVRALREMALESAHGNRTSADKISAAQSGRAMELMNQSLIWLADKLRISYGEGALLSILKMLVKVNAKFKLVDEDGVAFGEMSQTEKISLRWPAWYAPTAVDQQAIAVTLSTHLEAGTMSVETAVNSIADDYDVEDVNEEIARIAKDQQAKSELNKPRVTKQTVFKDANQMVVGSQEES